MEIEFGELPQGGPGQRGALYAEAADKLRANPGQWARIPGPSNVQSAMNLAFRIRHGQVAAFRPVGTFEATSRGADVWVRYVGDGAPDGGTS